MYRLLLLGGALLEGPDGPVVGRVGHRHRLALLALLVGAGTKGCSRDKLIAYLWPESESSQARHRLSNTLYVLRHTLGEDPVVVDGERLWLNPEAVWVDVATFEESVERGDWEEAARLYGGRFLDGFHLHGSHEFEDWLASERARLAGLHAKALESLAQHAERAADHARAAHWWKQLLATDPYNSRFTVNLMEALAAAGDPANAIQQALAHERLLRDELDMEPAPVVRAMVERLRSEPTPVDGALRAAGQSAAVATRSAIAILPFANMSGDPESEYFSDGITEEVTNAVARIPDLRVTARTSAFQFKGKAYDVREIGRRLSVGTVLEGGVRKAGDRVRVTAQLIDVAEGYHLWSQRFDRSLDDVFGIQDEISAAIAQRLRSQFTAAAPTPVGEASTPEAPPDPAAYDAYLRGRYQRRQMFGGGDALERALAGYQEAIEIDPGFALAYSALAELHVVLSIGFAIRPGSELMPTAREAAERALVLDPSLSEAHLARALVAMYNDWDYPAAKAGIDRAIMINPSSVDAYFWLEWYDTYVEGDLDKAVAANRRAEELDPLDLGIPARLGQLLSIFGRLDEAIERLERNIRIDPNHMVSHLTLADAYMRRGDSGKATAAMDRVMQLSPGRAVAVLGMAVFCYLQSGDVAQARTLLHELSERAQSGYVCPFWLAVAHAAFGEMDRAFEYLATARRDRDPNLLYITAVPRVVGLRLDPRYPDLMKTIGLGHLVGEGPDGSTS